MDDFLASGNIQCGGSGTGPKKVEGENTEPETDGRTEEYPGADGLDSYDNANQGSSS